jgi:hypothetical protein
MDTTKQKTGTAIARQSIQLLVCRKLRSLAIYLAKFFKRSVDAATYVAILACVILLSVNSEFRRSILMRLIDPSSRILSDEGSQSGVKNVSVPIDNVYRPPGDTKRSSLKLTKLYAL